MKFVREFPIETPWAIHIFQRNLEIIIIIWIIIIWIIIIIKYWNYSIENPWGTERPVRAFRVPSSAECIQLYRIEVTVQAPSIRKDLLETGYYSLGNGFSELSRVWGLGRPRNEIYETLRWAPESLVSLFSHYFPCPPRCSAPKTANGSVGKPSIGQTANLPTHEFSLRATRRVAQFFNFPDSSIRCATALGSRDWTNWG